MHNIVVDIHILITVLVELSSLAGFVFALALATSLAGISHVREVLETVRAERLEPREIILH